MTTRSTAVLNAEPDGAVDNVAAPALPGCFARGETFEETVRTAREAIAGYVAARRNLGKEAPIEEPARIVTVVDVEVAAAWTAGRAAR